MCSKRESRSNMSWTRKRDSKGIATDGWAELMKWNSNMKEGGGEVGGSGMGDNEFGVGDAEVQSVLGQDDWRRIGGSGRCKDQSPPFLTISLRNWHAARRARIKAKVSGDR